MYIEVTVVFSILVYIILCIRNIRHMYFLQMRLSYKVLCIIVTE